MAIIVFDDFNRANDPGSLGTANTGQAWSQVFGAAGAFSINSNNALWSWDFSDPPNSGAVVETGFTHSITSVKLVNPTSLPIFAVGMGILFRYLNANYRWQLIYYNFPGSHRLRLQRTYAGLTTTAIDITVTLSNNDVISCAYCGPIFEVFINGVSQGIHDDSINPQNYGTMSGLYGNSGSYFTDLAQRFDDFTVETNGTCTPTYNCTAEGCVDPGDGTGTYPTLAACLDACAVPVSYNCVDGQCIDPGDGTGTFATLAACQASGCGATIPDSIKTVRFDAGSGSSWYLVPPVTDSGDDLRSKTMKAMRATGRFHNAAMQAYGYDINDEINVTDLEEGTNASTRPQTIPDSANVAQSPRKQINVTNSVLTTVRISGDDTGQAERDEVHEITYEQSIQGVRR